MPDEPFRRKTPDSALTFIKRLVLWGAAISIVLIVLALAAGIALTRITDQKLEQKLAQIRATGAPTSQEELLAQAQEWREKTQNQTVGCPATKLLLELKPESFVSAPEVRGVQVFGSRGESDAATLMETWDSEVADAVHQAVDSNRATLDQVREIVKLPLDNPSEVIDFISQDRDFVSSYRAPNLLAARGAANLLALDALVAIKEQRPDDALNDASSVLVLSRYLNNTMPSTIGYMISIALRGIAIKSIVQPAFTEADFSEEAMARFLNELCSIDFNRQMSKALKWERLEMLNFYSNPQLASKFCQLRARLLPFWHNADKNKFLELYDTVEQVTALPYPEFVRAEAEFSKPPEKMSWVVAPLANFISPSAKLKKQVVTQQVMEELLSIAMALRSYKLANGAYPEELQALCPDFLPVLPNDRFTEKPLIYRKTDEGCVVYSAGPDMNDDGGIPRPLKLDKDDPSPTTWFGL